MSMTTTDTMKATEAAAERCGQCGAPAAPDQRYCVNCGFHRRNARDPVARYLSEASAARTQVAAAQSALASRRRRVPRLGHRVVTLLVALALLAGIAIGNAAAGSSPSHAHGAPRRAAGPTTHKHAAGAVKNATGSSYLKQEENLPNTVNP